MHQIHPPQCDRTFQHFLEYGERRDMMLFDEDPHYWKILEELAG
ncbi:MAG: hypothetical protein AAF652_17975 [Cyanobacteria bacterium P01_C01_bin.72]